MNPINNIILLEKGQYLAPDYLTSNFDELLVGITQYGATIETGLWHAHEKPMISFVLYGHNTEIRACKTLERAAGSVNFYRAYEQHKNIYNRFPSKHISLELDAQFLAQYEYSETDVELAVQKNQDSIFTFIKLMNEAQTSDLQSKSAVEMLFLAFMEGGLHAKEETQLPDWMKSVRDHLNDRWNENVSLEELARDVNIHPTTISKFFRKYFQCTFGEYMRKLKVVRSIHLLHQSNHSLTEITYQCGFSDQSHFTRVFKSMTGYLPKIYAKL